MQSSFIIAAATDPCGLQVCVMIDKVQFEEMARELRTVSNKQVELFDRLRHVEERLDMLLERVRRIEDTIKASTRKQS